MINGTLDSTIKVSVSDEILDEIPTWKITYDYEDNEDIVNNWTNVWFDKENGFITKMNFSSEMQGENQYEQWDLYNMSYNSI